MAKKKQPELAADGEAPDGAATKAPKLDRERRVRRAWQTQARCAPALVEFTEAELDGFAALVNEDGSFDPEIKAKFQSLYLARRDRLRAEAAKVSK